MTRHVRRLSLATAVLFLFVFVFFWLATGAALASALVAAVMASVIFATYYPANRQVFYSCPHCGGTGRRYVEDTRL